jgi:hypothetical protein
LITDRVITQRLRAAAGWIGPAVALGVLVSGAATDSRGTGSTGTRAGTDTIRTASASSAHPDVGFRFPDDGWMGTYAVNGRPTFCIDLNGRGPSTASGYNAARPARITKQVGWSPDHKGGTADALTGAAMTTAELGQLAYATDRYAATTSPVTAAAAEHVVRLLTVGDAAQVKREKVRWVQTLAAHPTVKGAYAAMARDVHDHAGPYTVTATWAAKPTATTAGTLTVAVLSAAGLPMPKVVLTGTATGVPGARILRAATDRKGRATVTISAQTTGELDVAVTARGLPAAVPLLYTPQFHGDARSPDHAAQRTVGAAPRTGVTATATATISPITPKVTTTAQPKKATVASDLTDDVTVAGALPHWTGTVTASLWGPFAAKPKPADCAAQAAPAAQTSLDITTDDTGAATAGTPPVNVAGPGWYTWTEALPGTPLQDDVATACGAGSETYLVTAAPTLALAVTGTPHPGSALDADLTLTGSFPGATSKVGLTLYGPFAAAPTEADCTSKAKVTATSATFTGDDTVTAATLTPALTGYYTWTASLPASASQAAASIDCADPGSTFAVARDDVGALDVTNTSTAGALTPAAKPPTTGATIVVSAADKGANLKAPLVPMSLLGAGVGTPASIALAGVLDVGAHPGDRWGTVVVAGRVGDAQGTHGALFPLQRVAPGDTVTVTDTNHRMQKFVVDTVATQPRVQPLAAGLFTQGQGPLRLVILTATDATTYAGGTLVTHVSHWIVTASAS